jgi:hypothetical protein
VPCHPQNDPHAADGKGHNGDPDDDAPAGGWRAARGGKLAIGIVIGRQGSSDKGRQGSSDKGRQGSSDKGRQGSSDKAVQLVGTGDDDLGPPELGEAVADRPIRHGEPVDDRGGRQGSAGKEPAYGRVGRVGGQLSHR